MILRFKEKFKEQYDVAKPKLIEIGVDANLFSFKEKAQSKQLIYVGRIHPHKNPSILLQIFAKLVKTDSEYKLKVIGGFSDELYEEYFYDQLEKLSISNNVEFLGKMTQPEMVSYLQESDFFLITSIIEGLSQASLEAMACGVVPVIDNYYGSDKAYPSKYIYNTVDDAVEMILNPVGTRKESREFIEERYVLSDKVKEIKSLIDSLI
jgi:glycosyltransferase involved in cell wall biosynthesis